jgi:hypothetical protein
MSSSQLRSVARNNVRPLLVATGICTIHQAYNTNKPASCSSLQTSQGNSIQVIQPSKAITNAPPQPIKHDKAQPFMRIVKRVVEVATRLFPLLVSYLLRSSPVGETRENWLQRLVQTLAQLGKKIKNHEINEMLLFIYRHVAAHVYAHNSLFMNSSLSPYIYTLSLSRFLSSSSFTGEIL